jgi:hypothetical protein
MSRIDEMWNALKAECCKLPPDEAKMVVFLTEEKFRKAMASFEPQLKDGGAERRFEAKLLNFADDERILLCADCLMEAINHNLVIFSYALPVDAATAPTETSARCDELESLD